MNILDKIDRIVNENAMNRSSWRSVNENHMPLTITWKAIDQVRRYTSSEIIKFMVDSGRFAISEPGSNVSMTPKEIADSWGNDFRCIGISQVADKTAAVWILDGRSQSGRKTGYNNRYDIYFDPKTGKLTGFYASSF